MTGGTFTGEARRFAEKHQDIVFRKPIDIDELRQRLLDLDISCTNNSHTN